MTGKIVADYGELLDNEFYKLYVSKLAEYSKGRAVALRDAPLDKVAQLQGELRASEWALSRPEELFKQLTQEAK